MQDVRPVDTHVAIEGEDEHHEKKPVTTKVKERVKKLKNTVAKKIRGNNHDHDNDNDHDHDHDRRDYEHQRDRDLDMDEDEEEDEEEGGYLEDDEDKLVDSNPEVHGAPMYGASTESAAVTDRGSTEHEKARAGESKDPPKKVRLGEDPAAPDSSTPQSRGGEVISSVSPIIQSFEAMSVDDKPEGHGAHREAVATPPTGAHEGEHDVELEDQRDLAAPPVSTGFHDQLSPEEPLKIDENEKRENQQSYTEKLKSAAAGTTEYGKKIASAAYDKAAVAGATVLAKVRQPQGGGGAAVDPPTGSHEEEHDAVLEGQRELAPTGSNDQFSPENQQSYTEKLKSVAAGTTEYGKNIASAAYDKAAVAGAAVLSKVQQPQGGGAADTTGEEGSGNREKRVSVIREYIAEKLKPGEEDKALSEVISDAIPTRKGERKGEIEHKASEEEGTLGSEGRSEGEEIRHKAGEGVTGSGGETEQKESEQVISEAQTTEEKAGEEVAGSDERRGGGVTMMEKIRGAVTSVTSLISSNGTSSKSPVTDRKEKGGNADIVEGTN